MLSLDLLATTIRATILSTRVSTPDTHPVSMFVVAPFENGKTSVVIRNVGKDQLIISDLTGMGLLEAIQKNPTATSIIINDLTAVTGHRGNVPKLTISVLNALAEEGVYKIAVPRLGDLSFAGRKMNVISCMVPELLADKRNWWHRSGFLSRNLVLRYRHSIAMTIKIHDHIQAGTSGLLLDSESLRIPSAPVKVLIPSAISTHIRAITMEMAKQFQEFGYRKHKHLRALACGHALMRGWKNAQVNQSDVDFLLAVTEFLRGREI